MFGFKWGCSTPAMSEQPSSSATRIGRCNSVPIGIPAEEIYSKYQIETEIGSGGFGKVFRAVRKSDNMPVALKLIYKARVPMWSELDGERVPNEVAHHARVNQVDGVIEMIEHGLAPLGNHVLVLHRPQPVLDLFDFITYNGPLDEQVCKIFFRQLLDIVIRCHDSGVVHRDLKDENILVDMDTGKIKLIDFGSAALRQTQAYTNYDAGTRVYCPPEWVRRGIFLPVAGTVWSLGILLFDMLCGDIPFETEQQILRGHLSWARVGNRVSNEAKQLVHQCLAPRANHRPSLETVRKSQWLNNSDFSDEFSTSFRRYALTAAKRYKSKTGQSIYGNEGGSVTKVASDPDLPATWDEVMKKQADEERKNKKVEFAIGNTNLCGQVYTPTCSSSVSASKKSAAPSADVPHGKKQKASTETNECDEFCHLTCTSDTSLELFTDVPFYQPETANRHVSSGSLETSFKESDKLAPSDSGTVQSSETHVFKHPQCSCATTSISSQKVPDKKPSGYVSSNDSVLTFESNMFKLPTTMHKANSVPIDIAPFSLHENKEASFKNSPTESDLTSGYYKFANTETHHAHNHVDNTYLDSLDLEDSAIRGTSSTLDWNNDVKILFSQLKELKVINSTATDDKPCSRRPLIHSRTVDSGLGVSTITSPMVE